MKRILAIAAAVLLLGVGCGAPCIKSHQAMRRVPSRDTYSYHRIGKMSVRYKTGTIPAHDEAYTVCDEYAKDND